MRGKQFLEGSHGNEKQGVAAVASGKKHSWRMLAKGAVTLVLLVLVFRSVDPVPALKRLFPTDWGWTFLAMTLLAGQLIISAVRWYYVCKMLDTPVQLRVALRLFLIGHFFSQALPSAVGGDAVRAWLLSRLGAGIRRAISAVFCDRAFAMAVLLACCASMIPLLLGRMPQSESAVALSIIIGTLASVTAIGAAIGPSLAVSFTRWKVGQDAHMTLQDLRRVFYGGRSSVLLLGLAIMVHTGVVIAMFALGRSINAPLGLLDSFLMIPLIMIVSVVPISIAGWGLREGAMVAGLALVGVPSEFALAMSIAFGLLQLILALPGAALWAISAKGGAG